MRCVLVSSFNLRSQTVVVGLQFAFCSTDLSNRPLCPYRDTYSYKYLLKSYKNGRLLLGKREQYIHNKKERIMAPKERKKAATTTTATVVQHKKFKDGTSQTTVYKKKLYTWSDLPEWQKDNEHILSGYVLETNSYMKCFHSLFYIHNESINVYSHLLPAIGFLLTLLFDRYVLPKYESTTITDYIVIDLFMFGAFSCLILSSTFHCFKAHSHKVASFGNKLDYLGIVILIMTSMISILYYGFHDSIWLFSIFTLITTAFGIACAMVSLKERFRSREWRPYRACLFVAFGLSAVLPIFAGIMYYGIQETYIRVQLKWVILEGFFYIFGAFLYGVRFPERYTPGKYDIWGHSHQIFHVLVVIAALCHFKALLGSYRLVKIGLMDGPY